MKLLLATGNQGKVKDLMNMLEGYDFEVMSLADFPDVPDVVEDKETFLGNAQKKAREYFKQTGIPTLADDSGLEVLALNGEPGVYSARYDGEQGNDAKNLAKVLKKLSETENDMGRRARFRCVLVFVNGSNEEVTEGDCEGIIADQPRGENGFGYDPVFIHEKFAPLTLAEISRKEKNSVSHRGIAFRKMRDKLLKLNS